jgi:hypothetical protein
MVTVMDTAQHILIPYAQQVIAVLEQGIVAVGASIPEGQRRSQVGCGNKGTPGSPT